MLLCSTNLNTQPYGAKIIGNVEVGPQVEVRLLALCNSPFQSFAVMALHKDGTPHNLHVPGIYYKAVRQCARLRITIDSFSVRVCQDQHSALMSVIVLFKGKNQQFQPAKDQNRAPTGNIMRLLERYKYFQPLPHRSQYGLTIDATRGGVGVKRGNRNSVPS